MERTFYWQFLPSLGNIRVRFQLKCMILTKALLVINKSVFESSWFRFDGPSKTLVFYFSFFNFGDFLTTISESHMKK